MLQQQRATKRRGFFFSFSLVVIVIVRGEHCAEEGKDAEGPQNCARDKVRKKEDGGRDGLFCLSVSTYFASFRQKVLESEFALAVGVVPKVYKIKLGIFPSLSVCLSVKIWAGAFFPRCQFCLPK